MPSTSSYVGCAHSGPVREVTTIDFVPIPVGLSVSADERYAFITRNDRNGSDLLLVNDFR